MTSTQADITSTTGNDPLRSPSSGATHIAWLDRLAGIWRWRVHPDHAGLIDASDRPDWLNLAGDSRAVRVKCNDVREVWRVDDARWSVYVKLTRPPRSYGRMRRVLFGPDCDREQRVAEYAARHGIDTVRPIACGYGPVRQGAFDSVLITEAVDEATPLSGFWSALDERKSEARHVKNRVIDAAASLLARAHLNGLIHTDLHAGNLLIQPHADGGIRALFVDLLTVRTDRPVTPRRAIHNLAQFNQWFMVRGLVSDRVRFLQCYVAWRRRLESGGAFSRPLNDDISELVRDIEAAVERHTRKLYAKRDRRCRRDGRYFARLKLDNGWTGLACLTAEDVNRDLSPSQGEFTRQQWRQWLRNPVDLVSVGENSSIIKGSTDAVITRNALTSASGQRFEVVCKQSRPFRFGKRLRYLVRRSRPMLNWKRGHALLNRRIPTSRPLAVVEQRRWGLLTNSILITESIPFAHDLDALLTLGLRDASPGLKYRVKRELAQSLASVVRRLEAHGFEHRDFKASNIMAQWNAQSDDPARVLLVDLDGLRRRSSKAGPTMHSALQRLHRSLGQRRNVTLADRARFLRHYVQRIGNDADWRSVWRALGELPGGLRDAWNASG